MKRKGTSINAVHNGKERKPSSAKKMTRAHRQGNERPDSEWKREKEDPSHKHRQDGEECARTDGGDIEMERGRRRERQTMVRGKLGRRMEAVRGKGNHCHRDTGHGSGYCGYCGYCGFYAHIPKLARLAITSSKWFYHL